MTDDEIKIECEKYGIYLRVNRKECFDEKLKIGKVTIYNYNPSILICDHGGIGYNSKETAFNYYKKYLQNKQKRLVDEYYEKEKQEIEDMKKNIFKYKIMSENDSYYRKYLGGCEKINGYWLSKFQRYLIGLKQKKLISKDDAVNYENKPLLFFIRFCLEPNGYDFMLLKCPVYRFDTFESSSEDYRRYEWMSNSIEFLFIYDDLFEIEKTKRFIDYFNKVSITVKIVTIEEKQKQIAEHADEIGEYHLNYGEYGLKGKKRKYLSKQEYIDRKEEFFKSKEWLEMRYKILKANNGKCCCCGRSAKDGAELQVDHIIPISRDWTKRLDPDNLQVLCKECNQGKSNKDKTDWR